MPDELDMVQQHMEIEDAAMIENAQRRAAAIPQGVAGICCECDQQSPRLVGKRCAPCRDELTR